MEYSKNYIFIFTKISKLFVTLDGNPLTSKVYLYFIN